MADLPPGTVTFLLTDFEGGTALWEQAPEAMRAALASHDELFEAVVRDHADTHIRPRGEGDSRFAVFPGAVDAASAALAVRRAFAAEAWPTPRPIEVRIGIHTGEAQFQGGDSYGAAVNRCERIRGLGHGGRRCCPRRPRRWCGTPSQADRCSRASGKLGTPGPPPSNGP